MTSAVRKLLVVGAGLLLAGNVGDAGARTTSDQREAAINFAAEGAIVDWYADNDREIYMMDRGGRWYRATFEGPCPQLGSSHTVGFEPGLSGRFDRFSQVVAPYFRCQVRSVLRASRPAAKGGRDSSAR